MADGPGAKDRQLLTVAYSASTVLTGPVILGLLIDWMAGTIPWFAIGGVFVGMAGLFVVLLRLTQPKG